MDIAYLNNIISNTHLTWNLIKDLQIFFCNGAFLQIDILNHTEKIGHQILVPMLPGHIGINWEITKNRKKKNLAPKYLSKIFCKISTHQVRNKSCNGILL